MHKEISELIGQDARGLYVYRALRPLVCRDCGERIAEGALFSRWPLSEGGLRILPRCRKCVPLDLPERGEPRGSALTESLLEARSEDRPASDTTPPHERIREEVSKRLNPALTRTRRPRGR